MAKIYSTRDVFLEKMKKYCSYQERSHADVNKKLYELQLDAELRDEITYELIQQNFLNEERFARAIVRGKFRMNDWGKIKIKQALLQKGISTYCIKKALAAIPNSEYQATLKKLLAQKSKLLHESNPLKKKNQLQKFALSKGFEGYLVNELLGEEEDF